MTADTTWPRSSLTRHDSVSKGQGFAALEVLHDVLMAYAFRRKSDRRHGWKEWKMGRAGLHGAVHEDEGVVETIGISVERTLSETWARVGMALSCEVTTL